MKNYFCKNLYGYYGEAGEPFVKRIFRPLKEHIPLSTLFLNLMG